MKRNDNRDFDPTLPTNHAGYFARMKDRYYVPLVVVLISSGALALLLFLGTL